ncbi:MAG: twin-arginine translocase subunit TatC [Cephaloticoccus sp.]|nr:twin-arginine translocase subunit TatC [Cephaloticoccus sp.]
MGFFDHLEDLRWTLMKCAVTFLIFAVLVGLFLREFNDVLLWPLHEVQAGNTKLQLDLGTTSIMEGFTVVIQMCFMGGFVLSAPFLLLFIGQFVSPALTERELKVVLPLCLAAMFLFICGATFSFFLLVPNTLRVAVELNQYFEFVTRWTPGSYYGLLMWLVLGVGASFEFPLLIILLIYMGIMSTAFLCKYRRHAIIVIFIIAAIVTPTPDPITQTMFAAPLYVLFELAIIVGRRVEKNRALQASGI